VERQLEKDPKNKRGGKALLGEKRGGASLRKIGGRFEKVRPGEPRWTVSVESEFLGEEMGGPASRAELTRQGT